MSCTTTLVLCEYSAWDSFLVGADRPVLRRYDPLPEGFSADLRKTVDGMLTLEVRESARAHSYISR